MSATKLLDHWLNDHREESPCDSGDSGNSADENQDCQNTTTPTTSPSVDTPLHLVLRRPGHVRNVTELVQNILDNSDKRHMVDSVDNHGDTPLTLLRTFLEENLFEEAKVLADLLLDHGADPNHENECGWSLLSYSLVHQDKSVALTRTLLHHGSNVIPTSDHMATGSLPLCVLLRSIVRSQTMTNATETLHILGQVMSCQHPPATIRDHVQSAIVAEGSLLTGNGPDICGQVKSLLSAYWTQPKPLFHLSLQASRKRLGLKRLNSGSLSRMFVAPRLQHYLSYRINLPLVDSQTQNTGTKKTETKQNFSQLCHDSLAERIRIRLTATAYKAKK